MQPPAWLCETNFGRYKMRFYTDFSTYHATIHQSQVHLPWLLMLHGFMGSQAVFSHLIEPLKPYCNLITIDLAGHGKTETPANPTHFTTHRQVSHLRSIVNRLQCAPFYLYGYSMGGRLALQFSVTYPELLSGMIIESAHCGIQRKQERDHRKELDTERIKKIYDNYPSFVNNWAELSLFEHTPDQQKITYRDISLQQSYSHMAASLRGFGAGVMPDICKQLMELQIPIHYVAGSSDNKYVNTLTNMHQQTTYSSLSVVPDAGHRVHTDQPKILTQIIAEAVSNSPQPL